jgi:EF-hand domain pair
MTTTFRSALLAAAALAVALPAWAQTASPPQPLAGGPGQGARGPGALFDEMDANKDGRVTWDETWTLVQRRFATADADRDGGLTRQEADTLRPFGRRQESGGSPPQQPSPEQAARGGRFRDVIFRSIDANRDGRVTLDEVRPAVEARFRGLDADADNSVTRNELPQRRGGGPRSGGGHGGQGNQGSQPPATPR